MDLKDCKEDNSLFFPAPGFNSHKTHVGYVYVYLICAAYGLRTFSAKNVYNMSVGKYKCNESCATNYY